MHSPSSLDCSNFYGSETVASIDLCCSSVLSEPRVSPSDTPTHARKLVVRLNSEFRVQVDAGASCYVIKNGNGKEKKPKSDSRIPHIFYVPTSWSCQCWRVSQTPEASSWDKSPFRRLSLLVCVRCKKYFSDKKELALAGLCNTRNRVLFSEPSSGYLARYRPFGIVHLSEKRAKWQW
jgi:hypothetical protein